MSLSAIPLAIRRQVFSRDQGRCQYCGLVQIGQAAVFHINHVVPRSRGGTTTLDNLVLQCPSCSLHKSNKLHAVDHETGQTAELFHPLKQDWQAHFVLLGDGTCEGRTPSGRATIDALQMNHSTPLTARFFQIKLGLIRSTGGV